MRPYVETAFRHPLLLLAPAVLIPLLVAMGAWATTRHYEVTATVWAQQPTLVGTTGGTSGRAPSETEAETFSEHLSTEAFRQQVLTDAGLSDKVAAGQWPAQSDLGKLLSKTPLTKPIASFLGLKAPSNSAEAQTRALAEIQKRITVQANGTNLVRITYKGSDPETGVSLLNTAIKTYQDQNFGSSNSATQAILSFYQDQVDHSRKDMQDANSKVMDFQTQHPVAVGAARPDSEAQQLSQLQADYDVRLTQYEKAVEQLGAAQLQADAGLTSRQQQFTVVDAPQVPKAPTLDVRRAVTLVFMAVVFGFGLGAFLVLVRTWSDRTLQRAEDAESRLRVPVLATLPRIRKGI
jgi:uncharacterized protein involved in exopolysaccharide biosynthesis